MENQNKILEARVLGVISILAGLAFGYFGAYQLLSQAAHHAPTLTVDEKEAMVGPPLLVAGVLFTLFPRVMSVYVGNQRVPKTPLGWVFIGVITATGFAFWFWLQSQLRGYGYRI